jgi:hypothetical protein
MSEDTKGLASLYKKLAAIAGELTGVTKDKVNTQLKYSYASPGTVMSAVKPILAKHNVAIIPSVGEVVKEDVGTQTQSGAANVLTRVVMNMLILDGDTGECLTVPWVGEGVDWSDKGIAKAETIAVRTFLLNAFQIPSDDEDHDPDRASNHAHAPQQSAPPQRRQTPFVTPEQLAPPAPTPQAGQGASEKQVKAIYAIGRAARRWSESQVDDRSVEIFGVRPGELTKAEASQLIDMFKGEEKQAAPKASEAVPYAEQPPDWLEG